MKGVSAFVASPLPKLQRVTYVNKRQRNGPARFTCSLQPEIVRKTTLAWVRNIVVGLHLCPFAESVVNCNSLRVVVSEATSALSVKQNVMLEIDHLLSTSSRLLATTLVVTPEYAKKDFEIYQEFCEEMEREVENDEALVDQVVLAWFHPEFRWGGIAVDDAVNFDKRAPYPIINLLRADELDEYIAKGKTQHILETNQKMLRKIGVQRMTQLYQNLHIPLKTVES